jgi:pimeloyl-ACP methyl ester carboxylesterase
MPRRPRPALPYDERPMQTRASTPTDRAVPGDGVTLHARDWGGGGRPVVLLHGLASNARIWDGVAPRLAGAGLRVVAIDLRGHGDSDQPGDGYGFETVGRDLAAALDALGLARPVLAGHSWGAGVALQYAAGRSGAAAGLALVDGGLLGVTEWAGTTREEVRRTMAPPRFAVPLADWLARAKRFDAGGGPGGRPWIRDHLRNGVEVDDQGVARARFRFENHLQVIDAIYDHWPPDLYPLVDCPVLLCPAGAPADPGPKRDAVARALRLFPSASVTWFEDTMHDIPLQRPAELAAELARFAATLDEGVPGRG